MSFFTAPTTAPPSTPELRCSRTLWEQLLANLRERGRFGERESGAFLIGCEMNKTRQISQFVLYDDLDQHSLDSGIVHFDGRYYGALWERCRAMSVMVVADIHTHPYGPQQSPSDRAHPMIATAGHIALILPRFAMGELSIEDIGMYLYLGGGRWRTVPAAERAGFLKIDDASGVPA